MMRCWIEVDGRRLLLGRLYPGDLPASVIDYLAPGSRVLIVDCRADDGGGTLRVSRRGQEFAVPGTGAEGNPLRAILSADLVTEARIGAGATHRRRFLARMGANLVDATLVLEHVPIPVQA
jgi:hypothetical protein